MREGMVEESLYFPAWMRDELAQLAERLGVTVGTLAWAAWEAAKQQLYRMTALLDDIPPEGSLPPVAHVRPAPPVKAPTNLVLPAAAPHLDTPSDSKDKQMVQVTLPERVLRELRSYSIGADQSLSWTLQQAIRLVRPRLHAATVR
ncbi:MAG TPA: hypothetical protein VK427_16375 [Kofleriaceae bacterium]|nr:hypothetical protein [Kofleriaceae bacterium]